MDKEFILREEKIPKALLKLAIPAVIGILISAIYNVVDTLFVGMLHDTRAIGAIAVAFPLFMIIVATGQMLGVGGGVLISRYLGSNNKKSAERILTLLFYLAIGLSVIMLAFGLPNLEWILTSLGATTTILPYAKSYTFILVIGLFFTIINMVLNNSIRAEGNSKYSMYAIILGAVVNIALDPLFIFTLGYGIQGAAIATIIAQFISTIFLIKYYFSKSCMLQLDLLKFDIRLEDLKNVIAMGLPSFIRQILVSFSMVFYNKALGSYGDVAIASGGISTRAISLIVYTIYGFAQGFQPIVAYNFGNKNYKRILEAFKLSLIIVTIYCIACNILYAVFSKEIIGIFSKDPAVIEIGKLQLYAQNALLIVFGITTITTTLYQAIGKGKESFILASSKNGFFFVPLIYILGSQFGLNGIILSSPIADLFTGILTFYLLVKAYKKLSLKVEEQESQIKNYVVAN